jgi:hypothetical protein
MSPLKLMLIFLPLEEEGTRQMTEEDETKVRVV